MLKKRRVYRKYTLKYSDTWMTRELQTKATHYFTLHGDGSLGKYMYKHEHLSFRSPEITCKLGFILCKSTAGRLETGGS